MQRVKQEKDDEDRMNEQLQRQIERFIFVAMNHRSKLITNA